jgi:hypothetical protein
VDRFCPMLDVLSRPTPVTLTLDRASAHTARRARPAA